MEAFVYGGPRLSVYFSILHNLFLKHCYVPDSFVQSPIVPLVKCKGGDLTDASNYRAIALSNACTFTAEQKKLCLYTGSSLPIRYINFKINFFNF